MPEAAFKDLVIDATDGPVLAASGRPRSACGRALTSREHSPDPHVFWDVPADPEGNEFCVFRPDQR